MLVAIVSDTHLPRGGRRLPGACLEPLREAELILHAGDFVSARALAELETLGPAVAAVHGNVDSEAYTTSFFSRLETVVAYGLAITIIRRRRSDPSKTSRPAPRRGAHSGEGRALRATKPPTRPAGYLRGPQVPPGAP